MSVRTEILIPADKPARLISAIAEEIDYSDLEAAYSRKNRNKILAEEKNYNLLAVM